MTTTPILHHDHANAPGMAHADYRDATPQTMVLSADSPTNTIPDTIRDDPLASLRDDRNLGRNKRRWEVNAAKASVQVR